MKSNGAEALELFRKNPSEFDLIITDLTMPRMNGDRLAAEAAKIRPEIPVILSTGYSQRLSEERIAEIGIRALVHKPMVKSELARTVRRVLDETLMTPRACSGK